MSLSRRVFPVLKERDALAARADRLKEELAEAHRREDDLNRELTGRDTLAVERDELKAHAVRLAGERDESLSREAALSLEMERMRGELSQLATELDESHERERALSGALDQAVREAHQLRAELEAAKNHYQLLWAPPGHFYSPIADPDDPTVISVLGEWPERLDRDCSSVGLDERAMLTFFSRIGSHYAEIPFQAEKDDRYRYAFENPNFSYADGITLFGILLEHRPKRVIEVGSGYSSCLMMDTNDAILGGSAELRFIEPYPDLLSSLLAESDPYREHITARRVQDVPVADFAGLGENDILFIDSSHVCKTGSDVNDYLFRILPALQPGVLIHIHDIFFPFEYPERWIAGENRSWNEAYVLRAFLKGNDAFRVVFFNDLIYNKYRALTEQQMPLCLRNTGGSIWIQKVK